MEMDNEFDSMLQLWKEHIPEEVATSAVYVIDTLDLLDAGARAVFGDRVTPEIVIEIYRLMIDHQNRNLQIDD